MKKILTFIITCFLSISLVGCQSNTVNDDDVLAFFDALDNTLQLNRANINATVNMSDSKMIIKAKLNQKSKLQVEAKVDLEANGNTQKNFLAFYIKDGKTYLNNLGTKTQSTVDKIGLKENSKLSVYNPFLDFTDDNLIACFKSSKKSGDDYHFEVNTSKLATLLDSMGTISLDSASVDATIKNKKITKLSFSFTGEQTMDSESADIDVSCDLTIKKFTKIHYPSDLDSYDTTTEE